MPGMHYEQDQDANNGIDYEVNRKMRTEEGSKKNIEPSNGIGFLDRKPLKEGWGMRVSG
jgi:hypothetical protein